MKYFGLLGRTLLFQCNICMTHSLAEGRTASNWITEKTGEHPTTDSVVAGLRAHRVDANALTVPVGCPLNLVTNHLVIKYPLQNTIADLMRDRLIITDC